MPRKDSDQLQDLQHRMAAKAGRSYWRSLEELAESQAFQEYLRREFPISAPQLQASRREFLTLLGASLALAGLAGCGRQPPEQIVPYVKQPELLAAGKPLYFATAICRGGVATGLLVESHQGRPTKIEGNPRHPSVPAPFWRGEEATAPGVSDIFSQASILNLYDPDRSQTVTSGGEISTWDGFLTMLRPKLETLSASQGRGLRLLTETVTSPTLAAQIETLLEKFPLARWHQFEPMNRDNELAGARLALGDDLRPQYHLEQADVILSIDSDFLTSGPDHLRYAYDFAARRDVNNQAGTAEMNRLYVLESSPSLTGAKADHRLTLRADEIEAFALSLAGRLENGAAAVHESKLTETARRWLAVIADDLQNYRSKSKPGGSLVIAGPAASPLVHALVFAINQQLGNVGKTVTYTRPAQARPELQHPSLRELVSAMRNEEVKLLCMLGGNPVYNVPGDLDFSAALEKVPLRIHLGEYQDETSSRCHWHLPQAHFLESWGDARAAGGAVSIIQPLIDPLYQGKTPHELLAMLLDEPGRSSLDLVKEHWRNELASENDFESVWQTALHEGFLAGTEFEIQEVTAKSITELLQSAASNPRQLVQNQIEVVFRPDPTVWDGSFANNGWLQELPKPFTKLTWENAAQISPALAERMQLENGDLVELAAGKNTLTAPVWIVPGHPDQSITIHFGYGRTRAGRVGSGIGFDAYSFQSSDSPWNRTGVSLRKTGGRASLAVTQHHHLMEGRHLVRGGTLQELQANPHEPAFMHAEHHHGESTLYSPEDHPYDDYKWGMAIDLNRCTGCNACVISCQAENNIPVVGKAQVAAGREMHWIRVDSYYEGTAENPRAVHQPVPCMHCENAPCELVCPVAATVHSDEGLNEMVYNRCVGTRYCSNNCPYKVRRFNYLQYSDLETPSLKLLNNPDVTVRNLGVMEKCSYCVQRISAARIGAEKEDRTIKDGELLTACQAACPSQAILFGDLNDADSRLKQQAESPLNYALLEELNARPRTTYLAALRNPHPLLESLESKADH